MNRVVAPVVAPVVDEVGVRLVVWSSVLSLSGSPLHLLFASG